MSTANDLSRFQKAPLRYYWHVLTSLGGYPWLCFSARAVCSALGIVTSVLVGPLVDYLIKNPHAGLQGVAIGMGILGGFYILEQIANTLCFFLDMVLNDRLDYASDTKLFYHTLGQSYDYYVQNISGQISSRIGQSTSAVINLTSGIDIIFFDAPIRLLTILVVFTRLNPIFTLITVLCLGGYTVSAVRFLKIANRYNRKTSAANSYGWGKLADSLSNFIAVKTDRGAEGESRNVERTLRRNLSYGISKDLKYIARKSNQTLWQFFLYSALTLTAISLFASHELTVGQLVIVLSLMGQAATLSWVHNATANAAITLSRLSENLEKLLTPHEIREPENPVAIPPGIPTVEIKGLTFAYPKRDNMLKDLSVRIEPRQHVGLVGRSGAGKSTFVSLLLRLYDPQEGGIYFGADLGNELF